MKNLVAAQTIYLVNNVHVYGMAVAWAMKDVLGWEQDKIKTALMTAHTQGFCSLGEFTNAGEIQKRMETLLAEDNYLQKVFCLASELPAKFQIQDKRDVVQKLVVVPELIEVAMPSQKLIR